jgi:hypothetical protein
VAAVVSDQELLLKETTNSNFNLRLLFIGLDDFLQILTGLIYV